jgi:adenylate cyclase
VKEEEMVTSVEVLRKSRISRATLNNYIKAKILPRPVVRKNTTPGLNARIIGYFPVSVLDIIKAVKEAKALGQKIDSIAETIRLHSRIKETTGEKPTERAAIPRQEPLFDEETLPLHVYPKRLESRQIHASTPRITLVDRHLPSYLLNRHGEIQWINKEAEEKVFGRAIRSIETRGERNIFRLLVSAGQQGRDIARFHLRFHDMKHGCTEVKHLFAGIAEDDVKYFADLFERCEPTNAELSSDCYVSLKAPGSTESLYCIRSFAFKEGRLFLYEPAGIQKGNLAEVLARRSRIANTVMNRGNPHFAALSILVASLQDGQSVSADMPCEEFFSLIDEIWRCLKEITDRHSGICEKHRDYGMVCYFLQELDAGYLTNPLSSALELRDAADRLGMKWKMGNRWHRRLSVNMGIDAGQEYIGMIVSSPSMECAVFGEAMNCAAGLAEIGLDGSIWTTKRLVNQLSAEERKKFSFGIRKDGFTLEERYSLVGDILPVKKTIDGNFTDIVKLPATELLTRRA